MQNIHSKFIQDLRLIGTGNRKNIIQNGYPQWDLTLSAGISKSVDTINVVAATSITIKISVSIFAIFIIEIFLMTFIDTKMPWTYANRSRNHNKK